MRLPMSNLIQLTGHSVPLFPIAASSLAGQVPSRPYSCTLTRKFYGCGWPAVTDGLDVFCPVSDNRAAGAGTPACLDETCCMSSGRFDAFASADRRLRCRSGSEGQGAVAAAPRGPAGRLETVQKFSHGASDHSIRSQRSTAPDG